MKTKQPISKAKSMRIFFAPRARSPAPVVGGGGAPAPAPQPAPAVAPAPALAPAPAPRDRMAFFASAPTAAAVRTERRRKASKLIVAAKITNPSESFVDALSAMFAHRELHGRKPTVLSEVKGIMDGLITDVRKGRLARQATTNRAQGVRSIQLYSRTILLLRPSPSADSGAPASANDRAPPGTNGARRAPLRPPCTDPRPPVCWLSVVVCHPRHREPSGAWSWARIALVAPRLACLARYGRLKCITLVWYSSFFGAFIRF